MGYRENSAPSQTQKTDPPMNLKARNLVQAVRMEDKINISLEMKRNAYSTKEIADALQCAPATVSKYIKKGLEIYREMNAEAVADYRDLQVFRIEEQLKVWRPISMKVDEPDVALPALDRVMRLENQLMKLVGSEGAAASQASRAPSAPAAIVFTGPNNFVPPPDCTLEPLVVEPEEEKKEETIIPLGEIEITRTRKRREKR